MGLVVVFVALVFNSHVVLPLTHKENWGPFYQWQLFSGLNRQAFFDLELRLNGEIFFLTDGETFFDHPFHKQKKYILWFKSHQFHEGSATPKEAVAAEVRSLLVQDNIELVRVCQVKLKLSAYMLMDKMAKKEICEKVF